MKLTERDKFIAAFYKTKIDFLQQFEGNIYETSAQIVKIQKKARGNCWYVGEAFELFCAYSPDGKRKYFDFYMFDGQTMKQTKQWKEMAAEAAVLWAKGKMEQVNKIIKEMDKESEKSYAL